MAKRRTKSNRTTSPNLPESTLERARKQVSGELEEGSGESFSKVSTAKPATSADEARRERRSRRQAARRQSGSSSASSGQFSQRSKRDSLSSEYISEMLANPTIHVSEQQLHEEYGFVLADLRSMAILAAVLMIFLVLLAQFI